MRTVSAFTLPFIKSFMAFLLQPIAPKIIAVTLKKIYVKDLCMFILVSWEVDHAISNVVTGFWAVLLAKNTAGVYCVSPKSMVNPQTYSKDRNCKWAALNLTIK